MFRSSSKCRRIACHHDTPVIVPVLLELSDAALLLDVGESVGNTLPACPGNGGCGARFSDKLLAAMQLAASSGPGQTLADSMTSPKAAARGALPSHKFLPSFAGYAVFFNRSGHACIFSLL
jgi:hypothetical protein